MASSLYQGYARPANQIFKPGSPAYISGLSDSYPYDVAAAKALMKKAGYANGFSVELPFMQGVGLNALMPYVTQQLALLNIHVKQVTLSGPNAITELLSGKYPMVLWPLGNEAQSLEDVKITLIPSGYWNLEHEPDATVDGLWKKILSGTPQQQATAEQAMNRYIVEQAWFAPMVYADLFYASSPSITVQPASDPNGLNPFLWDFK
jgi:peptide/nickel transport system substrate-binding protein